MPFHNESEKFLNFYEKTFIQIFNYLWKIRCVYWLQFSLPKLRNKPAPLAENQAILSNAPERYDLILQTQGCIP